MPHGSGDRVTDERATAGVCPDLVGWKDIVEAIGHGVTVRTAQRWATAKVIPVVSYGGRVAAWGDRVRACLMSLRTRAA